MTNSKMTETHNYNPPHHHERHICEVVLVISVKRRVHWYDWNQSPWSRKRFKLHPNRKIFIMTDVTVGHEIVYTIQYLDQNGQPMLSPVTPDSAPVWSNLAAPTIDTMSVSADGSTDTVSAVGAGVDSVSVSVTVGGAVFSAVDQVSVGAAPQVLTSIALSPLVE